MKSKGHQTMEDRGNVLVVTLQIWGQPKRSSQEFVTLAQSVGYTVLETMKFSVRNINNRTFIGDGQLRKILARSEEINAHRILIDADLSPRQELNILDIMKENPKLKQTNLDTRSSVIIDVFANNARTNEAKLQVEMLKCTYESGRLVRKWTHLERQRGGSGATGGPGERQIEIDRRLIRTRISNLKKQLAKLDQRRELSSSVRADSTLRTIALVGYTNAGKTSLLQKLSDPQAQGDDRLFATLDPRSRRMWMPSLQAQAVVTDTVGFISDLPHEFVDAFASTLYYVRKAELLVVVVAADDPNLENQLRTIESVLNQIGAQDIPRLLVWNKADQISASLEDLRAEFEFQTLGDDAPEDQTPEDQQPEDQVSNNDDLSADTTDHTSKPEVQASEASIEENPVLVAKASETESEEPFHPLAGEPSLEKRKRKTNHPKNLKTGLDFDWSQVHQQVLASATTKLALDSVRSYIEKFFSEHEKIR